MKDYSSLFWSSTKFSSSESHIVFKPFSVLKDPWVRAKLYVQSAVFEVPVMKVEFWGQYLLIAKFNFNINR